MLKQPLPSRHRRVIAVLCVGLLACTGSYMAWAAQPRGAMRGQPATPPVTHAADEAAQSLPPPRYPKDAAAQRISGQVMLRVRVRADGSVSDVVVESSTPAGVFDAVSVEAARQWRFRPQMKQGKAVAGEVRVPITFEMDPTPAPRGGAAVASR